MTKAEQLAESWVNGNVTYVLGSIRSAKDLGAVALALKQVAGEIECDKLLQLHSNLSSLIEEAE